MIIIVVQQQLYCYLLSYCTSCLNNSIPTPNGRGAKNSRSILTEEKVLNIRENPDNKTHKQLALQYGVAESTISGIIARLRWTHI